MTQVVEILESMKRLVETKHGRTINFKKQTGRKVIGYTCPYVPIEIISAAGALPVWILGNTETIVEGSRIARRLRLSRRDCSSPRM